VILARLKNTWDRFVWKCNLFSESVAEDLKCLTELLYFFEMLVRRCYKSTSSKVVKHFFMFNVIRQLIKSDIYENDSSSHFKTVGSNTELKNVL